MQNSSLSDWRESELGTGEWAFVRSGEVAIKDLSPEHPFWTIRLARQRGIPDEDIIVRVVYKLRTATFAC